MKNVVRIANARCAPRARRRQPRGGRRPRRGRARSRPQSRGASRRPRASERRRTARHPVENTAVVPESRDGRSTTAGDGKRGDARTIHWRRRQSGTAAIEHQRGEHVRHGNDDVLDAGEGREPGETDEDDLTAVRGSVERARPGGERSERQGVRERIGRHVRSEEEGGKGDGERGATQRLPGGRADPARQPVDRKRGQRHRGDVDDLCQPNAAVVSPTSHRGAVSTDSSRAGKWAGVPADGETIARRE